MTIRAITFDFWRTLVREANGEARHRLRYIAFCEVTGVPFEALPGAWKTVAAEFDRCHREEQRTLHAVDFIAILADRLGVTIAPESARKVAGVFETAILEHPPAPVEGAAEALRAAAARFPLGLISDTGNSPGWVLRQLLDRFGFLEYFKVTIFSDEEKLAKPKPAVFKAAARGLGVLPGELLHIGDLEYSDVAGAKGLGARAALFTGVNDQFLHTTRADYVFTSWRDFVDLLPHL